MSLYDWNGDGKKDLSDDYIEYNIYNEVMNDDDENSSSSYSHDYQSSGSGSGCLTWIVSIFVMYILAKIFS